MNFHKPILCLSSDSPIPSGHGAVYQTYRVYDHMALNRYSIDESAVKSKLADIALDSIDDLYPGLMAEVKIDIAEIVDHIDIDEIKTNYFDSLNSQDAEESRHPQEFNNPYQDIHDLFEKT
ncbi:MAG: hypothetical protein JG718_14900 [Candidatus Thiothrix moscowensis]|nr:hypothetical protein [Candidatus Thiothrix moscowensis]